MGYDVHQLVKGRELWMGGIRLEHEFGLLGHSDADVLIHAICDAILGAANMRDIGYHFPDTSAETDGMDSKIILKKTIELIATKGYQLVNIVSHEVALRIHNEALILQERRTDIHRYILAQEPFLHLFISPTVRRIHGS